MVVVVLDDEEDADEVASLLSKLAVIELSVELDDDSTSMFVDAFEVESLLMLLLTSSLFTLLLSGLAALAAAKL